MLIPRSFEVRFEKEDRKGYNRTRIKKETEKSVPGARSPGGRAARRAPREHAGDAQRVRAAPAPRGEADEPEQARGEKIIHHHIFPFRQCIAKDFSNTCVAKDFSNTWQNILHSANALKVDARRRRFWVELSERLATMRKVHNEATGKLEEVQPAELPVGGG